MAQQLREALDSAAKDTKDDASPSEAAASEFGDLGDVEEDEKWVSVPRSRRKALLSKARCNASLATKLHGLSSAASSPFCKKP